MWVKPSDGCTLWCCCNQCLTVPLSIPGYKEKMFSAECHQRVAQYDGPLGPGSDEWLCLDCIVFGLISVDTHDSFCSALRGPCSTSGTREFHFGKLVIACPRCVYWSTAPCRFAGRGEEMGSVTGMGMQDARENNKWGQSFKESPLWMRLGRSSRR